mmetsp:Transcript_43641/g.94027  ORF Transcript_43641/g.94027 Transcript_43641/m.94027 type:complete len:221 (+) Transcript_43641:146-808(+)
MAMAVTRPHCGHQRRRQHDRLVPSQTWSSLFDTFAEHAVGQQQSHGIDGCLSRLTRCRQDVLNMLIVCGRRGRHRRPVLLLLLLLLILNGCFSHLRLRLIFGTVLGNHHFDRLLLGVQSRLGSLGDWCKRGGVHHRCRRGRSRRGRRDCSWGGNESRCRCLSCQPLRNEDLRPGHVHDVGLRGSAFAGHCCCGGGGSGAFLLLARWLLRSLDSGLPCSSR